MKSVKEKIKPHGKGREGRQGLDAGSIFRLTGWAGKASPRLPH